MTSEVLTKTNAAPQPKSNQGHLPGEVGIWVFIFGDLLVFSLFFAVFLFYRGGDVELFRSSQESLSQTFGLANTIIMLTSSWLVATAVHAARLGHKNAPFLLLWLGFFCGLCFLVIKVFEYGEKIASGITLGTNDFYMYYFVFTGIHAFHVIIGMGVLAFLAVFSRKRRDGMSSTEIAALESGTLFWHLVDLLWIVLFALLYLVN